MNITSTGNNFGAGQVVFKAALDDNFVVLNGNVPFDRYCDEYLSADVMEIKVPDLPMKRSLETAVYMTYDTKNYERCITIVRSWIKDKNTICIEKLIPMDDCTNMELVFLCAYLPKGQRESFAIEGQVDLQLENMPGTMWREIACAVVRDSWAMIAFAVGGLASLVIGEPFSIDLTNFPTDIACDVPFLGHWNYAGGYGNFLVPARIENGKFLAEGLTELQADYPSNGFMKAFIVTE